MAKNYRILGEKVESRPGAHERLDALREDTLAEIGLHHLRRAADLSQADLAAELGVTQSAVSQLENSGDMRLSTLRQYLKHLGFELRIYADADGIETPIRLTDA